MAIGINTTYATQFEWNANSLEGIYQVAKAVHAADHPFDFIRAAAQTHLAAVGNNETRSPALHILATDRKWPDQIHPVRVVDYSDAYRAWLYATGSWNPTRDAIVPPTDKSQKAVAKLQKAGIAPSRILFYSITLLLPFRGNTALYDSMVAWGDSASPYSDLTRLQEYAKLVRKYGNLAPVDAHDPSSAALSVLKNVERLLKEAQEDLATPSDDRRRNPRRLR
jgi:hypothetical protein